MVDVILFTHYLARCWSCWELSFLIIIPFQKTETGSRPPQGHQTTSLLSSPDTQHYLSCLYSTQYFTTLEGSPTPENKTRAHTMECKAWVYIGWMVSGGNLREHAVHGCWMRNIFNGKPCSKRWSRLGYIRIAHPITTCIRYAKIRISLCSSEHCERGRGGYESSGTHDG
jgi:hypothetical protein